jgi:1,4-alpha-glucan branching enzyme
MLGRPLPDSASLPPTSFVHFLQNHDQVGNCALGERLHARIDRRCHSVLTELLLFSPQIPLMFMGMIIVAPSPSIFSQIMPASWPTPSDVQDQRRHFTLADFLMERALRMFRIRTRVRGSSGAS